MGLPSLRQMSRDLGQTVRRFPLVVALAAIGTAVALVLIDAEGSYGASVLYRILLASAPGIPLLAAVALMAEKMRWSRGRSVAAHGAALAVLVVYAWNVPPDMENAPALHVIRLLLLTFAAVMLVSVGPYLARGEVNGFWHFNKSLFLRLLVALLYAHILFAGLALALGALDNLFGLDVPGKRYFELWVLLAGFFSTLFFLAGVPEDLPALERRTDYPKGLKVFAQYILLPLVLVYLVILYAYVGKILVSWEWPLGWVSKLILGFSGTGLFALLLLYPLSDRTDNQWIRNAPRHFALALFPHLLMFFLALSRRVGEYGITEGRYLAYLLGGWLLFVALYFTFSRSRNMKLIPATLCVLSVLASVGPWSLFSVSERSQVGRLRELLEEHRILRDGGITKAVAPLPFNDAREISAILSYLNDFHGYESIQPWFTEDLRDDPATSELRRKSPAAVAGILGIEYVSRWQEAGSGVMLFRADRDSPAPIGRYSHMIHGQSISSSGLSRSFGGGTFSFRTGSRVDSLTFVFAPGPGVRDSIVVDLRGTVRSLVERYGNGNTWKVPPQEMRIEREGDRFAVGISFWQLKVETDTAGANVVSYEADILYRVNQPPPDTPR